jgi:hypothetical protein
MGLIFRKWLNNTLQTSVEVKENPDNRDPCNRRKMDFVTLLVG